MKLTKRAKDKEVMKVHYEIRLQSTENLGVTGPVYVEWKRGSKSENKGQTKHVPVKDKKAVFDEVMSFDSTLYKLPKKGYEAKNVSFTLKEEKGKKGTSIAKTVIDLAEFAGKDERRSFSLKSKKSKVAPTLIIHFKSNMREFAHDEEIPETDGGVTEGDVSDEEDEGEDFTDDDAKSDKSDKRSSVSLKAPVVSSSPSTPNKRDSVNLNNLDVEQLRAELDKAKKRTKELATENVDYEDQIKDLNKELEDLKKAKSAGASPGPMSAEKEAEFRRKIRDLTQESSEKDETIKKLKKEVEDASKQAQASPSGSLSPEKEAQMKKRLKELATENVDLEDEIAALKKQLEETKSEGGKKGDKEDGLQKQNQEELRRKIKELTRANEDTEEEVESLKKQVEQLKKSSAASVSVSTSSNNEEMKKLVNELREKDDKISDLEDEIGRMLRKTPSSSSNDSAIQEYKDKIDDLKEKLRDQQDNYDKKLDEARDLEDELRERIRSLEDSQDSRIKKSDSSSKDSKERERLEREVEKEKESRKKAEKEVQELKDKVRELKDSSSQVSVKHSSSSNGKDSSGAEKELKLEREITSAVYSHIGRYSTDDGVSESSLAIWNLITKHNAHEEASCDVSDKVVDNLRVACNCSQEDMNVLFYWLSTTASLLHSLRDDPDSAPSNNDRDPIIDGIYQVNKEPSSSSHLQDRLEYLCFTVYKQLISVICEKLTPHLAPVIIDRPLTDKKTHVKTTPVMRILDRVLSRTRNHYLYDAIVQQLFVQIFYFISCHLVNTVLQKRELTPSFGFQIKLGLSHLEDWLSEASGSGTERALLAPCQGQLDGLRDAGGVLVLDKAILTDASTLQSIFKVLNLRQIRKLLEIFTPDHLVPGAIPPTVRQAMQATWYAPNPDSLPLLFDAQKVLSHEPQFD